MKIPFQNNASRKDYKQKEEDKTKRNTHYVVKKQQPAINPSIKEYFYVSNRQSYKRTLAYV